MDQTKQVAIDSSWVRSVSYSQGYLTVNLKNGKVYIYQGIPERVWMQLEAAPSKGKFINDHIKGKYKQI